MALPPLLTEHVEILRKAGYNIELVDGAEICVIFKGYKVPTHIWNIDCVDLLITTHPTYPNAKLDMFWLDPPLKLKSTGGDPQSTNIEGKCGRSCQRFSWHVNQWNPARDNLITYLDVVNDRLGRSV